MRLITLIIKGTLALCACIYRTLHPGKEIWLFFSRPDELDGNAYALYKWTEKKKKCYFILKKDTVGFEKGMICWGSIRHFFLSAVASVHVFDIMQNGNIVSSRIRNVFNLPTKNVFLQHGMTRADIPLYHYENTAYDLAIATNHREFDYLQAAFHYPPQNLAITGMARHDDLLQYTSDKKFILIMPTWRKKLINIPPERFKTSAFYKQYHSLLNNEQLLSFLRKNNIKIRFYLHYMIHSQTDLFSDIPSEMVYETTDSVHELIRDCSLLITDYSSVAFDAALAGKPIIYYQFQVDTYDSTNSYFQYDKDGFGPVVQTEESLINQIIKLWNGSSFVRMPLYKKRSEQFFEFHDTNNCQRIFDKIEELLS